MYLFSGSAQSVVFCFFYCWIPPTSMESPKLLLLERRWFNISPAPVVTVCTQPKLLLKLTFIEDCKGGQRLVAGGREGGAAPGATPPWWFSFPHYHQRNTIARSISTNYSSRGSDFIHHPNGAGPRTLQNRMTLDTETVFLLFWMLP